MKQSVLPHRPRSRTWWLPGAVGTVLLVGCVLTVGVLSAAQHQEFVIVVNDSNTVGSLSRARVDGMFLGKITQWPDGAEVAPAHNADSELCESFAQAIHSRSFAAVSAYWAAKTFRDFVVPPPKLEDGEVISFVAANPGAIGFVHKGAAHAGVKVLTVTD